MYCHLGVSDIVSRVQFSRCPLPEALGNTSGHSHCSPRTFRIAQDYIGVTSCTPTTWTVDASDIKIIGLVLAGVKLIDFCFVTADPLAKFCSGPLFDMDLEFLEKSETKWLKKWLRGNVHTVMMFFKRSKLFHSSSEKIPFVRISTSWFLVSTYLIWILEFKLIRSKNKSRAILWVLDTCLMKGLLPFIIILITASLFSKMYNLESSSEECMLMDVLFPFLSDRKFLVSLTWL